MQCVQSVGAGLLDCPAADAYHHNNSPANTQAVTALTESGGRRDTGLGQAGNAVPYERRWAFTIVNTAYAE